MGSNAMDFSKRLVRLGLLLTALAALSTPADAGVELVQLTPANFDQYIAGSARQIVHAGDVVLRNQLIQVVILTSSTDSDATRTGRCLVLNDSESATALPVASLQIGPGSVWKKPEAGDNQALGVVRFHRDEADWSAELTFRMQDESAWVEVVSKILNKHNDRVLEIPVVDTLTPLDGSEPKTDEHGSLSMASKSGISISYLAVGGTAITGEGRGGWNLGMISGDPTPSVLRRASARVVSLGRSPQLLPLDASRDWNRQVRERANWYRIEPQKQRTIVRRLVVGPYDQKPSAPPEVAVAPVMAPSKPAAVPAELLPAKPAPLPIKEDAMPLVGHRRPSPPAPEPTVEKPTMPGPLHTQSFPKITGKLRSGDQPAATQVSQSKPAVKLEAPKPLPTTTAPQPSLPPKITPEAAPVSTPVIKSEDLTPTIEAIEDLPPPTG